MRNVKVLVKQFWFQITALIVVVLQFTELVQKASKCNIRYSYSHNFKNRKCLHESIATDFAYLSLLLSQEAQIRIIL